MKFKYFYILLIPLILGIIIFSAFSADNDPDLKIENKSIIKFSHSLHADLAECADCHSKAVQSTSLKDRLMPDHDNCIDCHDVENSDECGTCHYEDIYEPLIQTKSDLFFNHKYHIEEKALDCETCHKGIKEVDFANEAVQPNPIMEDCYTCHNDRTEASNACESCHISTADLIPQNHKNNSFRISHKFAVRDLDANCVMCHDLNNNSCEDCHAASNVAEINTADDFYVPYTPNNFIDSPKKQKLNRVHELNYRFLHGVDAKGRTADCQSCHQVETFCVTCHQSEESDFALSGIVPASHLKPNFFTFGVGTGGGEHADLARRDIESCIACHDVQGSDPTCFTCHLDNDGLKGTNPKTHPANFMRNEKGDWHSDFGSVCYNCHTSASPNSAAGMGFCGYCHGSTN